MIGRITLAALACVSVFALDTGAAWAFSLTVTPSPQPAAAAAPVAPADWLVALRSGLAQRSAP